MAAAPNASNATGVQAFLKEQGINVPIINIPGCPPNPEWLCAVLIQYLLLGELPELNAENKPTQIFGQTIHDNCQRRGHFENGEFVYQFGSPEEAKATACTRWAAVVRKPRPTAALFAITTVVLGALKPALPASAAAKPTRTTRARTGSRSTLRSSSVIAI